MFVYPQGHSRGRRTIAIAISSAAHVAVVALLCVRPRPILIHPTLTAQGDHGTAIVLYFAPRSQQETLVAEPAKPRTARLYLPRQQKKPYNARSTDLPDAQPRNADAQVSSTAPGTTEGRDPVGFDAGPDVKPAVEITLIDPPVSKAEIPRGLEGDVVVEVTIDAQGNVTATRLLKGLGHGIDDKVMATVRNWHYIPATKYGVPIPSRYDAHFYYKG